MSPDSSIPLKAGAMRAHRDGGAAGITAVAVILALVLGMISANRRRISPPSTPRATQSV
jgi:hypothetical protein